MKTQNHTIIFIIFLSFIVSGCFLVQNNQRTTDVETITIPARVGEKGNRRTSDEFREKKIKLSSDLKNLRQRGLEVFSTPFNVYDGLGDGPSNPDNRKEPGGRLTLPAFPSYEGHPGEGNKFFLRVNGLDSQTCLECHSIVDNSVVPSVFGVGGVGGASAMAFPGPTKLETTNPTPTDSDAATYDGRVINPPFVFGSGGVELLAMEMTAELQEILDMAPVIPNKEINLITTHGIDFGTVFWKSLKDGKKGMEKPESEEVKTNCSFIEEKAEPSEPANQPTVKTVAKKIVKKIIKRKIASLRRFVSIVEAPLIYSDGKKYGTYDDMQDEDVGFVLDVSKLEGIDGDLVVKPFGRKGNNVTTRDFDCGAIRFHMGMEPVEIVGTDDHDGDGVKNEVTITEMSALAIYNTTTHRPRQDKYSGNGEQVFTQIGCHSCHSPVLKTSRRILPFRQPETPRTPFKNDKDKYYEVDLVKVAHFEADPNSKKGMLVKLFSDLKRHDMGPELTEVAGETDKIKREFVTARLWGLADTAPYLHDGRATTITEAIEWHGGEAKEAKEAFLKLEDAEKQALLKYLRTLHAPTPEQLIIK